MVAAVDPQDQVLLLWRYRWVLDRWSWEIPGGYVEKGENDVVAAAREFEEETGWRVDQDYLEHLVTYEPMVGAAEHPCSVFIATNATIGDHQRNDEAVGMRWVPLKEARGWVNSGEIVSAATVLAIFALCGDRSPGLHCKDFV